MPLKLLAEAVLDAFAGVVQFAQAGPAKAVGLVKSVRGLEAGIGPERDVAGLPGRGLRFDQVEQARAEAVAAGAGRRIQLRQLGLHV